MRHDRQSYASQRHSNAYNIFILVLTLLSLVVMVLLLLPPPAATLDLLNVYDSGICVIFHHDFTISLKQAPAKRHYFVAERGWLDLLGSIPSLRFLRATASSDPEMFMMIRCPTPRGGAVAD